MDKEDVENIYSIRSMRGYYRETIGSKIDSRMQSPSLKLIKRYQLNLEKPDAFIFWLMEQYFEGNLVEKQKGEKDEIQSK